MNKKIISLDISLKVSEINHTIARRFCLAVET